MFRTAPAPVAAVEPAPDVDPYGSSTIPVSHLALDLDEPAGGWVAYLKGRGVEVVEDGIGRSAVSSADARQLFDERREADRRKQEMLAQQDARAIAADKAWRSQLPVGLAWYDIPDGVPPVVAMTANAKDADPRRRSMVEDLLDRRDTMVFHPMPGEEAS